MYFYSIKFSKRPLNVKKKTFKPPKQQKPETCSQENLKLARFLELVID